MTSRARERDGAPPRVAYSVPEVAKALGVSRATGYRLVDSGDLPSVRIRGRVVVLVDDFQHFLAARERVAA